MEGFPKLPSSQVAICFLFPWLQESNERGTRIKLASLHNPKYMLQDFGCTDD